MSFIENRNKRFYNNKNNYNEKRSGSKDGNHSYSKQYKYNKKTYRTIKTINVGDYLESQKANRLNKPSVKIIPLGGLDEIGKNMTLIEYEDEIIIIDCGMAFPDNEMLGVDIVIPDFSYIVKHKEKVKGIFITHGHEDHIGGLSYLFNEVGHLPVYGSELTIGLIEGKLKERKLMNGVQLNVIQPGDVIKMRNISVEFIAVNHSIPAACGMAITTPAGIIVHTGDFKIDYTPINDQVINLSRFAELGKKGVLVLMSDSTNSERPGMTASEKKIGESFQYLFKRAGTSRIIIATFASNIHRIQQIMDIAAETGRKVAISGKSMESVVAKAIDLGYLQVKPSTMISIDHIRHYKNEQLIIVTTGSQGEPMSALKRMSTGSHRKVSITQNDFIIISATPIPGNEKFVNKVINELMKLGAQIIYEDMYEVHVSGHACQDEQKIMLNLVKPQYFIPVHGEYKHLKRHAETAISMGMDIKNVHIGSIGEVIEVSKHLMNVSGTVTAGNVMVDGSGIGDVGNVVLKDRKILSEDGLIFLAIAVNKKTKTILAGPDVVSRGFVYVKESEDILVHLKKLAEKTLRHCLEHNILEWTSVKAKIKESVGNYLYFKTKRRPMILIIIEDVEV